MQNNVANYVNITIRFSLTNLEKFGNRNTWERFCTSKPTPSVENGIRDQTEREKPDSGMKLHMK